MSWLLLGLTTIAACELLIRIDPLSDLQRVREIATRAVRLVANGAVSDHWKERVLPRYALGIATSALKSFGLLLLALSPFALAMLWPGFQDFLLSWPAILTCSALGIGYIVLRARLGAGEGDYSAMDRVLHRLALASPSRAEMFFDLESSLAKAPADQGRPVFVTGLARAGTTVLMRAIYHSGGFASLTYRDMPFVMAPNLWARLQGKRASAPAERAHGDGILVDLDSPEALEEPFWRAFCGAEYLRPSGLVPHMPDGEVIEKYRAFVGHVLARYGAPRYLAKNNNAILRLPALREAFPEATIIVPFRHPLNHAASLQRQHARFMADPDPFTAEYMALLAHHEFGQDQRPFLFGDAPEGSRDGIDYWLAMWISVYRYLSDQVAPLDLTPVAYEDLCDPESGVWDALAGKLEVAPGAPGFAEAAARDLAAASPELLAEAEALYAQLRDASRGRLKG